MICNVFSSYFTTYPFYIIRYIIVYADEVLITGRVSDGYRLPNRKSGPVSSNHRLGVHGFVGTVYCVSIAADGKYSSIASLGDRGLPGFIVPVYSAAYSLHRGTNRNHGAVIGINVRFLVEKINDIPIEYSGANYTACPVVGNRYSVLEETAVPEAETVKEASSDIMYQCTCGCKYIRRRSSQYDQVSGNP